MAGRGGSSSTPSLKRVRAVSTHVLRALCAEGGSLPSEERISPVTQDLHGLLQQRVNTLPTASIWSTIGETHLGGLAALFGLALRRSVQPDVPSAERDAYTALRSALAAHLGRLQVDISRSDKDSLSDVYYLVSNALVRTQTLRCYSAILAGLAFELSATESRLLGQRALGVLKEAVALLEFMALPDIHQYPDGAFDRTRELVDSRLLEHCSRALLLATRLDGVAEEAAALMQRLSRVLGTPTVCWWRSKFFRGRVSTSFLLTSHLVCLAAALDGGTTYGMPYGPGAVAAPLFTTCGRPLRLHSANSADVTLAIQALWAWEDSLSTVHYYLRRHAHGPADSLEEVCTRRLHVLQSRIAELEVLDAKELDYELRNALESTKPELDTVAEVLAGQQVPPYNMAASRDVSMRLAACAAEALAAPAAGGDPRQKQQPEQQRARIDPAKADELGLRALVCARGALWNVGWAAEAVTPPLQRVQLERWWSLAVKIIDLASKADRKERDRWQRVDLQVLLALRTNTDEGPIPPEPSLDVATALRAGWTRSMELLRRRPGFCWFRDMDEYVNALSGLSGDGWAQALAFAAPPDVASLAASVAKTARRGALQLTSASAALRSEFAASGVSPEVSEYTNSDVRGRDSSRSSKLRGLQFAAERAVRQARELAECARQALGPPCRRVPFVHVLLQSMGRPMPASTGAAASEPAPAAEVRPAGREGRRQPSSGGSVGMGDQPDGAASAAGLSVAPATGCSAGAATGAAAELGNNTAIAASGGCDEPHPVGDCRKAAVGRLASALAQIAVRVLPEVTRLADSLSGYWRKSNPQDCDVVLAAALSWVPLLTAAAASGGTAPLNSAADGSQREQRAAAGQPCPASWGSSNATAPSAVAAAGASPLHLPAGPAVSSAAWDRFLWSEVKLLELLGLALEVLDLTCYTSFNDVGLEEAWVRAMWALLRLAPTRLAHALRTSSDQQGHGAVATTAGPSTPWRRLRYTLSLSRAREVLRPGGAVPQPKLLAALERVCAGGPGVTSLGAEGPLTEEELQAWVAASALLPSPGEVLSVLPVCGNPLCTNLEGDSEADLKLSGCGRCGGRVRYCSRECQVAHWKAAHKAECCKG